MTRIEWCGALAKLVSPMFPIEAAQALVDMLPALRHLPDNLFTGKTLTEVAMAKRRQSVPAFDEIVRALEHYRNTFIPDPTLRLAAPSLPEGRPAPSPEEAAIVAELVAGWASEVHARELNRINGAPLSERRDVTLKGDHLAAVRRSRGVFPRAVANRAAEAAQPQS